MKKSKENRRRRLEVIAREGNAFCKKHEKSLSVGDIYAHKCYTGNHGKSYCKYLEIDNE